MDVGVDCVDIMRFKRMCDINPSLLDYMFSINELSIKCADGNINYGHLAGVFAAKEATLKALSPKLPLYKIKQIEIKYGESGKPFVILKNGEKNKLHISISHSNTIATAVCIVEGD